MNVTPRRRSLRIQGQRRPPRRLGPDLSADIFRPPRRSNRPSHAHGGLKGGFGPCSVRSQCYLRWVSDRGQVHHSPHFSDVRGWPGQLRSSKMEGFAAFSRFPQPSAKTVFMTSFIQIVQYARNTIQYLKTKYRPVLGRVDASFHADPSLIERGSSRKLRAPMVGHRARVGSVDTGDEAMERYASQGFEALASTRAEPNSQTILTDGGEPQETPPKRVECETCDGEAVRVTWGATPCVCYRCKNCHAGGHIAPDGTRQGGVFEVLDNAPTRFLGSDQELVTDGGEDVVDPIPAPELATDGGLIRGDEVECPECDATDWDADGRINCDACGYTPRASVRRAIEESLGGDQR